jgi:uncharacterized protein (DUF58 family)
MVEREMHLRHWANFRRTRYRITRGGLAFTAALLLVALAAALSANNLLFLIGAAMLATLMVSSFVSRLSLAGLQVDLLLPEHISARRPTPARIRLRNLKWIMPSVSIQISGAPFDGVESILRTPIYYPILPGRAVMEEAAEVIFPRRGEHGNNLFVFTTRFPFGFIEKKINVALKRDTLVYPAIESRPEWEPLAAAIRGELESQAPGGEHDFYRIRPYVSSESARHLDWKSTARTGELQVREFAREQRQTLEIILDRRIAAGQEEWLEKAIECCAFLVWEFQASPLVFRSQRFVARVPDDSDIYGVLRFLAVTMPDSAVLSEPASDEPTIQVLLSADPQSMVNGGWRPAHLACPAAGAGQISAANERK